MACGGMIRIKNFKLKKKKFSFYSMTALKNLKRQSEHSGLRPDTSSLVTIYLKYICLFSLNALSGNYKKGSLFACSVK